MGREDVHLRPSDVHRCRKRTARLPALNRQVDALHVDDRMPRSNALPKHWVTVCRVGTKRALIAIQGREHDGLRVSSATLAG